VNNISCSTITNLLDTPGGTLPGIYAKLSITSGREIVFKKIRDELKYCVEKPISEEMGCIGFWG